MRKVQYLFLISSMLFAINLSAQHISLMENRGEIGVMGGTSFYHGDIASDVLFYKPNFGVFYKKQLNDYIGVRFNYEYISLGANDIQSSNFYDYKRGLYFTRTAHELSIMGEFYFSKFMSGNKNYRFAPYLGFGFGGLKSINGQTNVDTPSTNKTFIFPLNLGFKYNLSGPWNLFGEVTYRFTSSDKIDYFSDDSRHIPIDYKYVFQASSSGNDQYFSTKLGVSYNLLSIYGPDRPKTPKKWFFFKTKENQPSKSKSKGFFSKFKGK